MIVRGRQLDVGFDAIELRGAAGDAVEFLDRQLERAGFVAAAPEERHDPADLEHRLHGALAEGARIADDDRTTIVLQGRGEDFARTGAQSIGQDDHRSIIRERRIAIVRDVHRRRCCPWPARRDLS